VPDKRDWELESGLADDFDATIVDANFGVREKYVERSGSSDPMLLLVLESTDLDQPQEQGYSTGAAKGWEVIKDGKEIVSTKKPDSHAFVMSSRAGELVSRIVDLVGAGNKDTGRDFMSKRGLQTQAQSYIGLAFHWKREERKTVGGDVRQVLLPVVYLGEKAGKASGPEISEADLEKIQKLAEGKTWTELKNALVKDPDIKKDNALMTLIFHKGLITKLETEGKLVKVGDRYV